MRLLPISLRATWLVVGVVVAGTLLVRFTLLNPQQVGAPGRPLVEVRLTLQEYSIAPARVTVPAGSRVRLLIENRGNEAHELEIEGLPFEVADLPPGDQVTLVFDAPPPGQYILACHLPGHFEQGMRGTLLVGPE